MMELVDMQDLESCEATRTGSIPAIRTKIIQIATFLKMWLFYYINIVIYY